MKQLQDKIKEYSDRLIAIGRILSNSEGVTINMIQHLNNEIDNIINKINSIYIELSGTWVLLRPSKEITELKWQLLKLTSIIKEYKRIIKNEYTNRSN